MKKNSVFLFAAALIVLIALLLVGAAKLIGGAAQFVLGTLIVLALIVLVIWMFAYAKRHR